jgi:molybdate transport system substrate-binding protein
VGGRWAVVPLLPVLALVVAGFGACARAVAARPALVFAAASLTGAFEELARAFEAAHPGLALELHFAGTSQLALQVREGAPADVFASADEANMQQVLDTGHVVSGPAVFARNRLVIVTARGNPLGVAGLADLAREDVTLLLCAPEVPAGRYARLAAAKAGVALRPASDEPNVKAVVSKVALGEADAGVVYATDAAAARGEVDAVAIAAEHDVVATYPIAALDAGAARETGAAFVAFVLSAKGQAILREHGFAAP